MIKNKLLFSKLSVLFAGLFLLSLTSCGGFLSTGASLRVDVEVYKGPLSKDKEMQWGDFIGLIDEISYSLALFNDGLLSLARDKKFVEGGDDGGNEGGVDSEHKRKRNEITIQPSYNKVTKHTRVVKWIGGTEIDKSKNGETNNKETAHMQAENTIGNTEIDNGKNGETNNKEIAQMQDGKTSGNTATDKKNNGKTQIFQDGLIWCANAQKTTSGCLLIAQMHDDLLYLIEETKELIDEIDGIMNPPEDKAEKADKDEKMKVLMKASRVASILKAKAFYWASAL